MRQFVSGDVAAARRNRALRPIRDSVRRAPAVRRRGTAAAHLSRRNLRGPVGADSAVVVRGAGRRDRAAQSLGLAGHRRQGRVPPRAGRKSVGPMHGGLSLRRRRRGRIDHRPRLGRPGADLRKRQPARRVAPLQPRPATRLLGDRPRTPLAGTDAPDQLRADGASSSRCAAAISHDQILDGTRAARPDAPGAPARALPLRSVEPGKARRAMLGGLRNPGAGAGDAARARRESSAS